MQVLYRKLLEVEIRHDYFLLLRPGINFPRRYDISRVIDIQPSGQTAQVMEDHKMLFRYTATGFVILIQAEFISSAGVYVSVVDLDPNIVLSFYWSLLDPHFVNFTNQRLLEDGKKIYYFTNRSSSIAGGITYLNNAIPPFGTTYLGEALYHLGDIISEAGETYEMIEKEAPVINFPGNISKWQKINTAIVNYVNPGDRLYWQFPRFIHQRSNTSPGEFITYKLLDANSLPVDLGLIPGTNRPQNEYRASVYSNEPVNYTLDISHPGPGKYTMEINESGGITRKIFYLLDPMIMPELFAVSEFFVSGAALPFQFSVEDPVLKRWVLDNPAKKFMVYFRNRLTRWKYLKQDQTLFHQAPAPRPLTQNYSGYQIPIAGGGTLDLPDPPVNPILPELETATNLIKNIYSNIFITN